MTATLAPVTDITPQAALSPLDRYCAKLIAATAFASGVTPQSVWGLSSVLDPSAVGMIADELAAMRAQAS